jgi:hypothetical protein
MFTELCNTSRTIELEHVHRFTQPWEAEASLLLRQGDRRALDTYQEYGRIRAGTLAEHLDHSAHTWITNHHHGETTALMASTNQHVDLINAHVQTVRRHLGHIHDVHPVLIGAGETADIGDIVATRRNHRQLTTSTGERVRNRDLWTVTATHDNGDLTLTPLTSTRTGTGTGTGTGTITLPADYVTEHVRLGYAATEMGTQSDTVTTSLELASPATTCRNLYVAMTRGRHDNTVCVITDTHDIADARDILDTIITIDRADTPATTQRRTLHTWFEPLRQTTIERLATAVEGYERDLQQSAGIADNIAVAEQRLQQAQRIAAPFEHAITRTVAAHTAARDCRDTLADQLATAKRRDRPLLRSALAIANHDLAYADTAKKDGQQRRHTDPTCRRRNRRRPLQSSRPPAQPPAPRTTLPPPPNHRTPNRPPPSTRHLATMGQRPTNHPRPARIRRPHPERRRQAQPPTPSPPRHPPRPTGTPRPELGPELSID